MYTAFLVGTAGSGKSVLTNALSNYLKSNEVDVVTLNMDPGVLRLPYNPDYDVREYISIDAIMSDYELGPNGALVAAVDLITSQADLIYEEINDRSPDILLIDTPGQMELFAFRPTGVIAAKQLGGDNCALVYLMDTNLCREPYGLINSMMLSLSVQMRFFFPQLNVISKSDLVEPYLLEQIQDWLEDGFKLEDAINEQVSGEQRELAVKLFRTIEELDIFSETFPVSATVGTNVDILYGKLQTIWQSGEDFQVEDRVIN